MLFCVTVIHRLKKQDLRNVWTYEYQSIFHHQNMNVRCDTVLPHALL
jgi:hypothetical protein